MQLHKKPEKVNQDFNGIWTRDLAIPVRRSNQLSYEATDVGSWSIMCSYVPVKEVNVTNVYEINHMFIWWWWWWWLSLLLQVIPIKVNYNYFTLYKASSLNRKIFWSKKVSFFVFVRCRIFIRQSHGSRLSAIVKSDCICFYWNRWMKVGRSFWYTNHVKEKVKSTIYSWFVSRGTSRLKKWNYKARYELLLLKRKQQLNNSLQTTKLKLMSC